MGTTSSDLHPLPACLVGAVTRASVWGSPRFGVATLKAVCPL